MTLPRHSRIFLWHLNDFGRIDFDFMYFLVRINFGNDWMNELIFLWHVNDWMNEYSEWGKWKKKYEFWSLENNNSVVVQNRTDPKENLKSNQSKSKPQKTAFGLNVFRSFFLLNRMVWFDLRFWFYQPNQTKPQYNKNIN